MTSSAPYYQNLNGLPTDSSLDNFQPSPRESRDHLQSADNDAADHFAFYDNLSHEVDLTNVQHVHQNSTTLVGAHQEPRPHQHQIDESLVHTVKPLADGPSNPLFQDQVSESQQQQARYILPRPKDTDIQQRTAEEVVNLLDPEPVTGSSPSKKRKRGPGSPQPLSDSPGPSVKNLRFKHYGPQKRRKQGSEDSVLGPTTLQLSPVEETQSYAAAAAAAVAAGPPIDSEDVSFFVNEYPPNGASTDTARAAAMYSAAALFRKPSENSKKYTRPPMSKLFSSLLLTPENFLRLQAAAKAYMLAPEYPDRRSCVGNRGKGDTDMTKLRLYNCVKEFLEEGPDGGYGVIFFGNSSVGRNDRAWEWPTDVNRVISLCTPLLRRMVTNERQRQYALDTRKGGESAQNLTSAAAAAKNGAEYPESVVVPTPRTATNSAVEPHTLPPAPNNDEDFNTTLNTDTSILNPRSYLAELPFPTPPPTLLTLHPPPHLNPLHLEISIIPSTTAPASTDTTQKPQHPTKILGQLTLPGDFCHDYTSLFNITTSALSSDYWQPHTPLARTIKCISALTPEGLVRIRDQEAWTRARGEVEGAVWMLGQMRVVVEVEDGGGGEIGVGGAGV